MEIMSKIPSKIVEDGLIYLIGKPGELENALIIAIQDDKYRVCELVLQKQAHDRYRTNMDYRPNADGFTESVEIITISLIGEAEAGNKALVTTHLSLDEAVNVYTRHYTERNKD